MWKITGILLVWSVLACACNLDQEKDPIIVPVVEDEFYLDLWQEISPAGANLIIEFETLTEGNCLNAEVLSSYERINSNLTLTLYEILEPETCEPGLAPARGKERLVALESGTYNLLVELQEVVQNSGILHVDESGFQVDTPTNGFQWRHGRIERIPREALWGYISYTNEEERTRAEQQLSMLDGFTVDPHWASGYYGYFTLSETGGFSLADRLLPGEANVIPFVVHLSDVSALNNWLDSAEGQLTETMGMKVSTGTGANWEF